MPLLAPKLCHWDDEDRASRLWFPAESVAPDGRYYLRGGICWPTLLPGGGITGYAVLCGQEIKSGSVFVFEEMEFAVVDNVLRPEDGGIQFPGLAPWFNRAWSGYFADTYFWHQPEETHRKYLLQVLRSPMVNPGPHFVEVPWAEDQDALHAVYERDSLGRLRYRAGGGVNRSMLAFQAARDPKSGLSPALINYPALWALTCAVAGLDRFPFRGER